MAQRGKAPPKDQIEVFFGFKQILGALLISATLLSGAFLWGVETGHRRAVRGEASYLGMLEGSAKIPQGPVEIPEVLMQPVDAIRQAEKAPPGELPEAPPSVSVTAAPTRAKPSPGVQPTLPRAREPAAVSAPSPPAAAKRPEASPETRAAPAAAPPARAQAGRGGSKLHFQIAALREKTNAKALADWLRSAGFPARIQPQAKDGLHRVFAGPFSDPNLAEAARVRLVRDGFEPLPRQF